MDKENNFHISFFKPTTPRAKYNRNMVLWLISIWAVAIFGFHFLLKAIEKPTPEPELLAFNEVWPVIKTGNASTDDLQVFANATLHVAGKVFIKTADREALDNGITWATMQLADSAQKEALWYALSEFETATEKASSLTDEDYLASKNKLGALASAVLNIPAGNVLGKIIPLELRSAGVEEFSGNHKAIVEQCMPLYTIHNRSVLTDTRFLGFPFHYFYTAVFLLILFIGLCWVYCYKVDKYNESIQIAE